MASYIGMPCSRELFSIYEAVTICSILGWHSRYFDVSITYRQFT